MSPAGWITAAIAAATLCILYAYHLAHFPT